MARSLAIVAAIVLGFSILYLAYDRFAVAKLTVTSDPAGAAVRLNGTLVGTTPLLRQTVPAGRLKLSLQHSHYAEYEELVELSTGRTVERSVVMPKALGLLTLLSNPKGAIVSIDGEVLAGKTPIDIEILSGVYAVTMALAERRSVTEQVAVVANSTTKVNFVLNKEPHGELTVSVKPGDAKVEFLNFDIPYAPKVRVPLGEYSIRVSQQGYLAQEFRYKVGLGANQHHITLKRQYGALQVVTQPANARVTVAYSDGGRRHYRAYQPNMQVPVGRVEVSAQAMGRRSQRRRFELNIEGYQLTMDLPVMNIVVGSNFADKLRQGGNGPELVRLAAGTFTMGSADGPVSERPQRKVQINQPFAMSKYEITVSQYALFADATNQALPKKVSRDQATHPIRSVSWQDAVAYAEWLSAQTGKKYRLPSETEWEYAARANTNTKYYYGSDANKSCVHANLADLSAAQSFSGWDVVNCTDGFVRTAPVGSFAANPFGLHDIMGNVAEWVAECGMPNYGSAGPGPEVMRLAGGCSSHGYRGGSWDSTNDELRVAYRNTSGSTNEDRGFRLVREL